MHEFTLFRPLRDQELNSSFMSLARRRYGTDLTHQSGNSVNGPAGRSEWSGISHFTRLPPVASCKPTQIGRMIREMSTMRKASCARPVHRVYQRKGRWAASTAKFATMYGLAPLHNWLPARSLCKITQLRMQIPRVVDSTSSIAEDQSLMQELGNENL